MRLISDWTYFPEPILLYEGGEYYDDETAAPEVIIWNDEYNLWWVQDFNDDFW